MLFFQVGLVGGYAYAHIIRCHLTPRKQTIVHLTLLVLSLFFLPITPSEAWKPIGSQNPFVGVILLLSTTVGVPYLLVSSSSPLIQYWFNRVYPARSPYRLYALSNLGSLLGLLTYPFAIELLLSLKVQTVFWSVSYGLYTAIFCWCAVRSGPVATETKLSAQSSQEHGTKPLVTDRLLWLLLTACGSVVLLAVTNQMCQDVAVIPFLWILPLSLYLITFIISFDRERWYQRTVWVPVLLVSLAAVVYVLQKNQEELVNILQQIVVYSAALFACCMVCHGELVRLKPAASHLTSFYLMVAVGGALGGVLVNLAAPYLFDGYWELHVGFAGTYILLWICYLRRRNMRSSWWGWWLVRQLCVGGAGALIILLGINIHEKQTDSVASIRNFYGVLQVCETDAESLSRVRTLYHGQVCHGEQFLDDELRRQPTTYYG
ncbi:MAG: hypothetical protein JSV03_17255, partial [Planctomycetota bacterium]